MMFRLFENLETPTHGQGSECTLIRGAKVIARYSTTCETLKGLDTLAEFRGP